MIELAIVLGVLLAGWVFSNLAGELLTLTLVVELVRSVL